MSTRLKTNLGFGFACLLILVAIIASNLSTAKFVEDAQWTSHSYEVRSEVQNLLTQFLTAQNNIRGYHLSVDPHFLNIYRKALQDIDKSEQRLTELTKDNPKQQQNLEVIVKTIQTKVKSWEDSFEKRRKGGFKAVMTLVRLTSSKDLDRALFEAIDQFRQEEDHLFQQRIERAQTQGTYTVFLIWTVGVFACLLVGIAAHLVYRDSLKRELAEADMNRFFTISLDLLCIGGMDGFFKRISPSFSELLGYPLQELYSKPILDFVHPEDIPKTQAEIEKQLRGNKVLAFENRFRCRDGSYRSLSWKSVPVGDFMYAAARDVTDQKLFEAELVKAREAALNSTSAKTEFLANMSHEIRTPLNGVVGMADLLARTQLDTNQATFLAAIRHSTKSLLKIVNEILDFSKIEAGQMRIENTVFNLAHLVESKISLMGVIAQEKGLELKTQIQNTIPSSLKGDSGKIGQILLNLISNAIKFTENGSILVIVEPVDLEINRCRIKVRVQDSGIGMTEHQASQLFQPFVQADGSTARKYGGTGLGLSISKKFIEMMGGEIGVESTLGLGSTFWFTLPLEISNVDAPEPETPFGSNGQVELVDPTQMSKRKAVRILIAEDNPVNQIVIVNMLSVLGYTARLVKNGVEAVEEFKNNRYDLILMDQHMPVMDGMQAAQEIRKLEEGTGQRVPIIAFTATVIQEEKKELYLTFMDDFMLKPLTIDTLEKTLERWSQVAPKV